MVGVHRLVSGLVASLASVSLALTLSTVPATATAAGAPDPGLDEASAALTEARAALAGRTGRDATMALTSLRLAYPDLTPADRQAADALLARPTDGAADPEQFGYTVPEATPVCGTHICVHYVPTSPDAPALTDADANGSPDWVDFTLAELESVLAFEVGTLGYRLPPGDGAQGGSPLFDVYLSQLGDEGLYGFCMPENRAPGERFAYSSYCVLDNDFGEFPLGPVPSLTVTAAHELFHAIQFGYDAAEDRWLLEATATWIEERYADSVDDNRQYLGYGQLGRPRTPLDEFEGTGAGQYGNWLFFELVSQRFGTDAVRRIWEKLDAAGDGPDRFSAEGVRAVVQASGHRSFADFYARFATANQAPRRFYSEGATYRAAPVTRSVTLRPTRRVVRESKRLDHLTSAAYRFRPSGAVGARWRLRLSVDAPTTPGAAATALVRKRGGGVAVRSIDLHRDGDRTITMAFAHRRVVSVTLVLANGSTRFKPCWRGTAYSCQGRPTDDDAAYSMVARLAR